MLYKYTFLTSFSSRRKQIISLAKEGCRSNFVKAFCYQLTANDSWAPKLLISEYKSAQTTETFCGFWYKKD